MTLDTDKTQPGPESQDIAKSAPSAELPMSLDGSEIPATEADEDQEDTLDLPEAGKLRRNLLLAGGGVAVAGTLAYLGIKVWPHTGNTGTVAKPIPNPDNPVNTNSGTPKPVESASATPEIPKGAVSFDAAMTEFESMTQPGVDSIINTHNYAKAAGITAALYVNAAQQKESFVDATADCEVADPVYEKNPVFHNMMGSSVTAQELFITAYGGPEILAAAQTTERTTYEGNPIDVDKATRVIEVTRGIGAKDNAMLKGTLAEAIRRLKAPASDGTMNVRGIDFSGILKSVTFVGPETTVSIDGRSLPARRVKFYSPENKANLVLTIVAVPLEAAIYDIPKPTNSLGYKDSSALPTDKDGKPVYSDGTRVTIPMVASIELA